MKASYVKPLLPLRDIVIFPSMVVPLFVGREKSIKALQEVMKADKSIVLVTQKNSEVDDPTSKDLYQFGCLSKILQLLKLPDGTVKVLVEGEKRVKILKYNSDKSEFLNCEVEVAEDQNISENLDAQSATTNKEASLKVIPQSKKNNHEPKHHALHLHERIFSLILPTSRRVQIPFCRHATLLCRR